MVRGIIVVIWSRVIVVALKRRTGGRYLYVLRDEKLCTPACLALARAASPVVGERAEEEDKALRYGDAEMGGKKDHNEEEDRVRPTLDATTDNLLQSSLAVGGILTLAFD